MKYNERLLPFVQFLPSISPEYHVFIRQGLDNLPDYFFMIAPSSSGKYHPQFDHGYGGLVRHTVMAMKIALDLIRADFMGIKYEQIDIDIILISLLFHDAIKNGIPDKGYTVHEHPVLSAQFCSEWVVKNTEIENYVIGAISSHMGKWITHKDSATELPLPITHLEHLVHMADYIASRTYIMYDPELG